MIPCHYCGGDVVGNAQIEDGIIFHPSCKTKHNKALADSPNINQVFPNIKKEFFDKWEDEHGDCDEILKTGKKHKGIVRYTNVEHGISSYSGYDNNEIMEKEIRNAVNHPEEQGFPELIIWEGYVYDLVITPFEVKFAVNTDYRVK